MKHYDVIIIGAGIAGATAAILFARKGLKVALIDKSKNFSSYKKLCTHNIQSPALPILRKLGLSDFLKTCGGKFSHNEIWSRDGWIARSNKNKNDDNTYGYNVTRQKLDIELRKLAISEANVTLFQGNFIENVNIDKNEIQQITISNYIGEKIYLQCSLLVAADGRNSKTAQLADVKETKTPNNRFIYFTYGCHQSFQNMSNSKIWYLDQNVAYAFPNENNLMLLAVAIHNTQLQNFKSNLKNNFIKIFKELEDTPYTEDTVLENKFYGLLKLQNIYRFNPPKRMALIGDAALTTDPVAGVGIGWALQSAELLVNCTTIDGFNVNKLDESLLKYEEIHYKSLGSHHEIISKDSLANPPGKTASFIFSTAPKDQDLADNFLDFCARKISSADFFASNGLLANKLIQKKIP